MIITAAPPTPSVEHLPTIFRRIRSGEYRIPPFQREFVWNERQVIDLLESVYRGFPIGSILLWRVNKKVFDSVKHGMGGFPVVEETYPTSFVLDGAQRLSTLNGVFNQEELLTDKRLEVYFDLETERFVHKRDVRKENPILPLHSIFHPRALLEQQKALSQRVNGDFYIERAIGLLTVFQEYMIPVVSISERSPAEVVSIFQRINSTGTELGVVDFMRALTWSDNFDLNDQLENLSKSFEDRGFLFSDETLLKGLGIVCGLSPLPDVLLQLREFSPIQLHQRINSLRSCLTSAIEFVEREFKISSAESLPYEAQWLMLIRFVKEDIDIQVYKDEIVRWIWTSSYLEELQGRPDHVLARLIDDFSSTLKIGLGLPLLAPTDRSNDLPSKKFLRGKAMSVAYVQMLVRLGVIGEPLRNIPYDNFYPVFDSTQLSIFKNKLVTSARTIGNIVYLPDIWMAKGTSALQIVMLSPQNNDFVRQELLQRQFFDANFRELVKGGLVQEALSYRANRIQESAEAFATSFDFD